MRKWSQQLEPQVVEPREEKHYSARGSGNPFSLNRDSLDSETYLGGCLKKVRETLHLEYSKGKNIRAGFLSDIDSSPGRANVPKAKDPYLSGYKSRLGRSDPKIGWKEL